MLGHWIYSLQFGLGQKDRHTGERRHHGHTEADLAAFERVCHRAATLKHRLV